MKKKCFKVVVLLLFIGVICSSKSYAANKYTKTNYKSYKSALKAEYKRNLHMAGISYTYAKIKTPYGLKKTMLVHHLGTTSECATVVVLLKKGKTIMKYEESGFIVCMVSKDGKYALVPGASTATNLLKYSKGAYRTYKSTDPSAGGVDVPKMAESTMIKKYKLKDVKWKQYTPKKSSSASKSSKKLPNKIYGEGSSYQKKLKLRYKKNYLYLDGWYYYGGKYGTDKSRRVKTKIKVSPKCRVVTRAESTIVANESLKKYAKEHRNADGTLNYIGFSIRIKNNKVVKILNGD